MSGASRYGLVLTVAVAGLVLGWWVGHKGNACLGPEQRSGAEATEPTQRDRESAPLRRAVPEAYPLAVSPNESPGAQRGAVEARLPMREVDPADFSEPIDPDAPIGDGAEAAEPELPEGWAEITQSALAEPDAERRGEAIGAVSFHRGPEAVAVLTGAATADPEPDNRSRALQSLWYAAADGLDPEGEIKRVLEDARADPDPDIAELANKAVADLERLAARRPNGG